jgi:hypothetical protein
MILIITSSNRQSTFLFATTFSTSLLTFLTIPSHTPCTESYTDFSDFEEISIETSKSRGSLAISSESSISILEHESSILSFSIPLLVSTDQHNDE